MNITEFLQEHPRNLHTFSAKGFGERLEIAQRWLDDRDRSTLQIAHSTGLILPSAEEVLEAQGGRAAMESTIFHRGNRDKQVAAILSACSVSLQAIPEITLYVKQFGFNTGMVHALTENLKDRKKLQVRDKILYVSKDRERGMIRVLPRLDGYQTTSAE